MGLHDGHRKRLIQRFLEEGLDSFEPHNVLELLDNLGVICVGGNPSRRKPAQGKLVALGKDRNAKMLFNEMQIAVIGAAKLSQQVLVRHHYRICCFHKNHYMVL